MDLSVPLHEAPLVVIQIDAQLRICGWNAQAENVFATPKTEALGREIADVLPIADDSTSWASLPADAADPSRRVWPIRRGAAPLMLEGWTHVQRDEGGHITGITLLGYDATSRVLAEQRARLETTMLRAIQDQLDIAVCAVDKDGFILYQDGRAYTQSGVKPHQFVGQRIVEVYPDPEGHPDMQKALAGEVRARQLLESYGKYWMNWYVPVRASNTAAAIVGISLDVTESKRIEVELREKVEQIERQQEVIRELSTPIIEVWDGVLTLPIVGIVDAARAAEIMDNVLHAVSRHRARFAILDLTGIEVIDNSTANHLIQMIQAIRLLGTEGILTGIHPTIAQTIVNLGVDLIHIAVYARLRDALKHCIRSGQLAG